MNFWLERNMAIVNNWRVFFQTVHFCLLLENVDGHNLDGQKRFLRCFEASGNEQMMNISFWMIKNVWSEWPAATRWPVYRQFLWFCFDGSDWTVQSKVRRVFVCLFHQKTECSFLSFFLSFFSRPISHFVRHRRPLSFYYILFQHLFMCPLFLPPSICQFTRHTHTHTRTAFVNRRVPENVIKEIKRRKKWWIIYIRGRLICRALKSSPTGFVRSEREGTLAYSY